MDVIYHITTKLSILLLHLFAKKKESSLPIEWNVLFRRLERALFARKTSPRYYAAATRIKDVVQFSYSVMPRFPEQPAAWCPAASAWACSNRSFPADAPQMVPYPGIAP